MPTCGLPSSKNPRMRFIISSCCSLFEWLIVVIASFSFKQVQRYEYFRSIQTFKCISCLMQA